MRVIIVRVHLPYAHNVPHTRLDDNKQHFQPAPGEKPAQAQPTAGAARTEPLLPAGLRAGGSKNTHRGHRERGVLSGTGVPALPRGRSHRHHPEAARPAGPPHRLEPAGPGQGSAALRRGAPGGVSLPGRGRLAPRAAAGHYLAGRCAGIPAGAVPAPAALPAHGSRRW